ncbi:MAG: MATE family efflux transporter [Spirochaetales bacterium]|uniref:Multidrug export protein MepA n=1 Tax=Candidatus Thalassospirochaeta sargassi TaxID=3119039 RepID=A0AAJ1II96_9SPIO|nr:MATE family efflux transporter [Spirochaetales bacterium]
MNNDRIQIMENTPVRQAIIKLALPTMLSMAVVMIYNLTDTFFIGRLNNPNLVAALSIASPIFMAIQAIGNIFANGAASYISRKLGAKENDEAKSTASVAIYTAIAIGVVITAALLIFREPLLSFIGTSAATYQATSDYYTVISVFAIIFIFQIAISGLIRSEGATNIAMMGIILGIGLNIVLDPIFILVLDMGVGGAAWATAIGNGVGALYYIGYFARKKSLLSIAPRWFKPNKVMYGETFKIGIPSALSNLVMSFSMVLVNILAAGYGDHVVAGNGIQMRVASMAFMLIMGLAQGFQPFAGYNYGAEMYHRLKDGFKITLIYSTILACFFCLIFIIFGESLIGAFIKDQATVDAGAKILKAFAIAIPFVGLQMTMMITFQSVGKAINAMIVSLGRQCIIYVPALFILNHLFGFNGFIYAQPIADFLTTGGAVLMSLSFFKGLGRLDDEYASNENAAGEDKLPQPEPVAVD